MSGGDDTARRAAAVMWADDAASRGLGMNLDAVAESYARLSMMVSETMTNGHNVCHGGFIFSLADSAFAFACNATGQRAVASQCQIAYLHPARLGDTLVAEARERYREGRQGITDVTVTTAEGTVVAEFRGFSRTVPGSLLDDASSSAAS